MTGQFAASSVLHRLDRNSAKFFNSVSYLAPNHTHHFNALGRVRSRPYNITVRNPTVLLTSKCQWTAFSGWVERREIGRRRRGKGMRKERERPGTHVYRLLLYLSTVRPIFIINIDNNHHHQLLLSCCGWQWGEQLVMKQPWWCNAGSNAALRSNNKTFGCGLVDTEPPLSCRFTALWLNLSLRRKWWAISFRFLRCEKNPACTKCP